MIQPDSDRLIDELSDKHQYREALTCECGSQRFMLLVPDTIYCQNCAGELPFVWKHKTPS